MPYESHASLASADWLISQLFEQNRQTNEATLSANQTGLRQAAEAILGCCDQGGKVLACGNGGSAGDAQHFSSELVNRFEQSRQALAALALTTESSTLTSIANDLGYNHIFSRQIEALGRADDILLAISTSGHSANVVSAIRTAQAQNLKVLAFTGRDGGEMAGLMRAEDIELRACSSSTARIQEMHLLFIHCICRLIEDAITQ